MIDGKVALASIQLYVMQRLGSAYVRLGTCCPLTLQDVITQLCCVETQVCGKSACMRMIVLHASIISTSMLCSILVLQAQHSSSSMYIHIERTACVRIHPR